MVKLTMEDSKLVFAVFVIIVIIQRLLLSVTESPDLHKKTVEMAGDGVDQPGRQGK